MAGEDVVVNVGAKTVVQTKLSDSIRGALAASTPDWLLLLPGTDVVSVVPINDTVNENHKIEWRSAWQS
jgi:ABC-type arginine transport system permease subunit